VDDAYTTQEGAAKDLASMAGGNAARQEVFNGQGKKEKGGVDRKKSGYKEGRKSTRQTPSDK